jgi:hypothetical protein
MIKKIIINLKIHLKKFPNKNNMRVTIVFYHKILKTLKVVFDDFEIGCEVD